MKAWISGEAPHVWRYAGIEPERRVASVAKWRHEALEIWRHVVGVGTWRHEAPEP